MQYPIQLQESGGARSSDSKAAPVVTAEPPASDPKLALPSSGVLLPEGIGEAALKEAEKPAVDSALRELSGQIQLLRQAGAAGTALPPSPTKPESTKPKK